ncbi:hypothetical protein KZZ52_03665 [Dactylosporangium sp. AC04546]|uniref:hypothetical protein n=1 Tax=Dactylosporangium sp. AC04546 TaxID=2862460 RepID=UPI001EE003FE|nr:hypothetical protein [Dactylosporangium sp. AC04546]WVK84536.1 hypothetical protein KZZ52_03665 [Dactylosporangium sp. AC04546]
MDPFEQSDLIVDVDHLPAVTQWLGGRKIRFAEVERHETLRLALLRLPGAECPLWLESTIAELRDAFMFQYAGWTPLVGKNRRLDGVSFKAVPNGARNAGEGVRVGVVGPGEAAIRALAPRAQVRSAPATTAWQAATAMAGLEADLLYVAVTCTPYDGQPPLVLQRAVDVMSPRAVIVAPAGAQTGYPAASAGVVTVGVAGQEAPWLDCFADGGAATVAGLIAAGTVPGSVSPREAFEKLLADGDPVVRRYLPPG